MKYIIRFFVAIAIIFMFAMNILSMILLWDSLSELLLILWLIGSYILLILELANFELIVNDTVEYYKKGGINE